MDRNKRNIAIVAGGDSSEYEISIGTAQNILKALDSDKYNANIVEIKKDKWKVWGQEGRFFDINRHDFSTQLNGSIYSFDGVINAIHGTPGENGILQAYFDLVGIPYTGCDSFCSSLTFNKYACNNFLAQLGITVAPSFLARANMKIDIGKIEKTVGFPCFIKPNSGGSSCGTSRVDSPGEAENALLKAFREDDEVLVEKYLPGREFTCGMLITKKEMHVFPLTEIISSKTFFDYEAKYTPGVADEITPADLPEKTARSIKDLSITISDLLNCRGLIRLDFILSEEKPWFLEVNTVPGMSSNSIVPQQVQAYGMNLSDLYDLLLEDTLPA
jgi:D-alanine-D-alanine ligase